MKPWLKKFAIGSASYCLLVVALSAFAHRGSVAAPAPQASAIETIADAPAPPEEISEPLAETRNQTTTQEPEAEVDQPPTDIQFASVVVPPPAVIPSAPPYILAPGGGAIIPPTPEPASAPPPPAPEPIPPPTPETLPTPTPEPAEAVSSTPDVAAVEPEPAPEPPPLVVLAPIVINRLFIDMVGADNQEFIELFNPNDSIVSLASSSLQYLSGTASDVSKIVKKNFPAGASIVAQGSYVIGTGPYATSSPPVDLLWTQALSNTGASVLLVANTDPVTDAADIDIIDNVAYGSGTLLLADTPALLPPPGEILILY